MQMNAPSQRVLPRQATMVFPSRSLPVLLQQRRDVLQVMGQIHQWARVSRILGKEADQSNHPFPQRSVLPTRNLAPQDWGIRFCQAKKRE